MRHELIGDYCHISELKSGAFPCLFPLGVTAKDVVTSGPLTKIQTRALFPHEDWRLRTIEHFYCRVSISDVGLMLIVA